MEKPVGAFRTIKGMDIALTPPYLIAQELDNLLYKLKSNSMSLKDMAEFHILFERIHPFADGNGRVGRLAIAYQSIQNDIVPPLILDKDREKYLNALSDIDSLTAFLDKAIEKSIELIRDNQGPDHDPLGAKFSLI